MLCISKLIARDGVYLYFCWKERRQNYFRSDQYELTLMKRKLSVQELPMLNINVCIINSSYDLLGSVTIWKYIMVKIQQISSAKLKRGSNFAKKISFLPNISPCFHENGMYVQSWTKFTHLQWREQTVPSIWLGFMISSNHIIRHDCGRWIPSWNSCIHCWPPDPTYWVPSHKQYGPKCPTLWLEVGRWGIGWKDPLPQWQSHWCLELHSKWLSFYPWIKRNPFVMWF